MVKNVNKGDNLPASTHEIFGLLNSRIHEQGKKIEQQNMLILSMLEALMYQNRAIKSSKAIDSGLMCSATAAEICLAEIHSKYYENEKADEEAA